MVPPHSGILLSLIYSIDMSLKIAVILSKGRIDFLTGTVLDGLRQLREEGTLSFHTSYSKEDWRNFSVKPDMLEETEFLQFASESDLVLLLWGKDGVDSGLAEKIGRFEKTVYIDGSEPGKNRRLDPEVQYRQIRGDFAGWGMLDERTLSRCALHLRREKPYGRKIIPFPFGIESRYLSYAKSSPLKTADFNCIFGQLDFPVLRRYVQKILVEFCEENRFSYNIDRTNDPDEFYELLSRTKVGVSVSGGGYDTARFWEILGNNCLLLTEKIDIYELDSTELRFRRVYEFSNLFDFKYQLEKIGCFLRNGYEQDGLESEYIEILGKHSSKARVEYLIAKAREANIL